MENKDFLNEEEMDKMLQQVSDVISKQEQGVFVIDPDRVRDVLYVYELMHYIFSGTDTSVTYELSEQSVTLGCVKVETKEAMFNRTELLLKAVDKASTFEVLAKTNGKVALYFGFYDVAKKAMD